MIRAAFLLLTLLAVTPALAQDASPVHLRGTIAAIDGSTLTLAPAEGRHIVVHLAPNARVVATRRASLVDVTPGTYVGIANIGPDGRQDALEVHIFPEAMRGTGEGQRGWDLGPKSRMTNGSVGTKVESYDGQTLTLQYKGGASAIQVRPNTPVVAFVPGTMADLTQGAGVFVREATPAKDGSFDATAIAVGVDGTKPPM